MVAVMQQVDANGRVRQCNRVCHDSLGPKCRCICGGRYHGSARGDYEQLARLVAEERRAKAKPVKAKIAGQLVLPGVRA